MLHTRIPPHILCASALMLCALSPAHAQSSDLEASSWRFQLTPYVWTPSLRGSITVSPSLPTAHVSEPFSDIWKDLHASVFLNATARKDRYVLHLDMSHVSLHKSASLPAGFPSKPRPASSRPRSPYWAATTGSSLPMTAWTPWSVPAGGMCAAV